MPFNILENEQPLTIESLLAAFPFKEPLHRDGEPPRPGYVLDDFVVWRMKKAQEDVAVEWMRWAISQPDGGLLLIDFSERVDWVINKGNVSQKTLARWQNSRSSTAEMLHDDGHEGILNAYWPDNRELHQPSTSV